MSEKIEQANAIAKSMIGLSIEEIIDLHTKGKTDSEIIRKGQQNIKDRDLVTVMNCLFGQVGK